MWWPVLERAVSLELAVLMLHSCWQLTVALCSRAGWSWRGKREEEAEVKGRPHEPAWWGELFYCSNCLQPRVGSRVVRIDPLHFLAGCCTRWLNHVMSLLYPSMFVFIVFLFIRVPFSFHWYVFCLLVVLVKLSVLAKWLARKTPLMKPNRGEGIVSTRPRLRSVYDFLGLMYCFIVLLCVLSCPPALHDIFHTPLAWYSLFMLKVPLNTIN